MIDVPDSRRPSRRAITVAGYTRASRRVDRGAAWLVAPYLGWAAFATVLNGEIVRRDPRLD